MKKFLTLCAAFVFLGALFVGCIDNTEPKSVEALRAEKVLLIRAQTELVLAQAELNRAYAEYSRAQAEHERANAEFRRQQAESLRIANDFDRAVVNARIAEEISRANLQAAINLANMWAAQELARANEETYLTQLLAQRGRLAAAQIAAFDAVFNQIAILLAERANVQNTLLILAAQKNFYESVSMPFVENQLKHELEIAEINLTYNAEMFKIWTDIKDLAKEEALAYAEEMYPKMQEMKEREATLLAKEAALSFELEELRIAENLAMDAYENGGVNTPLTNIAITGVFDQNASDFFNQYATLGTGNIAGKSVVSGVYNNKYSFYFNTYNSNTNANDAYPMGTLASLGYKNTLDALKGDLKTINNERLFTADGKAMVAQQLKLREDYKDRSAANFASNAALWRESYELVNNGPNWATELSEYNAAKNAVYGPGSNASVLGTGTYSFYGLPYAAVPANPAALGSYNFYNIAALSPLHLIEGPEAWAMTLAEIGAASGANRASIAGTYTNYARALSIPDVTERSNFVMDKLPVNFLYYIQKTIIEEYMMILEGLIGGSNYSDWLGAQHEISDVLGGISFSPGALLDAVFTPGNMVIVNRIINTILDIAKADDLITMLRTLMPAYYDKTAAFWGPLYGDGPVFEKYHVNANWEYHAWFLIYYLMQGFQLNIGSGILVINVANFQDAVAKVQEDFLGASTPGYPGNWSIVSLPAQSTDNWFTGTAITAANRVSSAGKVFGGTAVNSAAGAPFMNVVAKENALRLKYLRWYRAMDHINLTEKALYEPYNRVWTVYDNATPAPQKMTAWENQRDGDGLKVVEGEAPWTYYLIGGTVNRTRAISSVVPVTSNVENTNAVNAKPIEGTTNISERFHFMPELALNRNVPSLTDELFWTDMFVYPGNNLFGAASTPYASYIGMVHSRLLSVNWTGTSVGYPKYFGNPVLWPWTKADGVTVTEYNQANWATAISNPMGETGSNIVRTLSNTDRGRYSVPTAMIAKRNYDQFAFWASDETQESYQVLADQIAELIEALEEKVEEMRLAWVDATAARILKEYEIEAMKVEAGLCNTAYTQMYQVYWQLLTENVVVDFFTGYEYWFNRHNDMLAAYNFALANYDTFMDEYSRYVYSDGTQANGLYNFVGDLRKSIDADIEANELRLKYIDVELDALYAEFEKVFNLVF